MYRLTTLAIIIFVVFIVGVFAEGKDFKVAIIDGGFTRLDSSVTTKLCNKGHYDFIDEMPVVGKDNKFAGFHGTQVALIADVNAKTKNVCFLIYKVFETDRDSKTRFRGVNRAIYKAVSNGAGAINMSIETPMYIHADKRAVVFALKRNVKIFVAAGNRSTNLNNHCRSYPTCFKGMPPGLFSVGAFDKDFDVAEYSNYGSVVDLYESGDTPLGSQGTSFASPAALGKYVKSLRLDGK